MLIEPSELQKKKVAEIRSVLDELKIDSKGTKAELIEKYEQFYKTKKKKRKRKKVIEKRVLLDPSEPRTQVEYVQPSVEELGLSEEFLRIFEKFAPVEVEAEQEPIGPEIMDSDSDDDMELDEEALRQEQISQKRLKKMNRPTVAQLKQQVSRPDVVEWFDTSAEDPVFLVQLKSYHNIVPVPAHWSQKRAYLQGKRGIEKPPFELPSFISATGVASMTDAMNERDKQLTAKAKARSKKQPRMGKLVLDYQRLHDAFFRFQTKPPMTSYGDLYHEGKEFEIRLKERRPGVLSNELKEALGITSPQMPPPWLLNMQRFGPPPSYPHLKIPGLNAPIPEGASWGYHPGGWGKAPVDEYGRPLYGDVFGMYSEYQKQLKLQAETSNLLAPIERKPWGEIETLLHHEDDESSEEDEDEEDDDEEDEVQETADKPQVEIIIPESKEQPRVKRRFAETKNESVEEGDSKKRRQ